MPSTSSLTAVAIPLPWPESPAPNAKPNAATAGAQRGYTAQCKKLKRRLEPDLPDAQSVDGMSFRELIHASGARGLLRDVDAWMVFRDKRNITSHTYNADKAAHVAAVIPAFMEHAQALLTQLQAKGGDHA